MKNFSFRGDVVYDKENNKILVDYWLMDSMDLGHEEVTDVIIEFEE